MKRRNFVKASVLGASVLALTPVTSLFAQSPADKFASNLDIASLDPQVTKHYVNFSNDFFAGLPEGARYDSNFQSVILPKKTISYKSNAKGYNLTFLNRNGEKVSFIKENKKTYTLICKA
ncbi:MAG: hypothetical protein AAF502_10150 [Bacteroidota bacterium]